MKPSCACRQTPASREFHHAVECPLSRAPRFLTFNAPELDCKLGLLICEAWNDHSAEQIIRTIAGVLAELAAYQDLDPKGLLDLVAQAAGEVHARCEVDPIGKGIMGAEWEERRELLGNVLRSLAVMIKAVQNLPISTANLIFQRMAGDGPKTVN